MIRAGPARGNQGAAGLSFSPGSLNKSFAPPVTGALGIIGLVAGPAEQMMPLDSIAE